MHENEALRHIRKVDPALYKAAKPFLSTLTSRIQIKRGTNALFASLAASVVSQQLSTKAADTIWNRLKKAAGGAVTPEAVLRMRTATMRSAGLSAAKVKTLKELAKAVASGSLNLPALRKLPEEVAVQELTKVWGIGTWTAEMFLIFALGRTDVFSPKDLGLIRAMELIYGIPRGSHIDEFTSRASLWAPYRSVACLILWRHWDQGK